MVWVGDRSNSESSVYLENDETGEMNVNEGRREKVLSSTGAWRPAASLPSHDFNINCDQFAKNIHDLNVLAGEGIAKIERTSDGARLKVTVFLSLHLSFFSELRLQFFNDVSQNDWMSIVSCDLLISCSDARTSAAYPLLKWHCYVQWTISTI